MVEATKDRTRKLHLHFDLNTTILMPAENEQEIRDCVTRVLIMCIWGARDPIGMWEPRSDKISLEKPEIEGDEEIDSFYDYLKAKNANEDKAAEEAAIANEMYDFYGNRGGLGRAFGSAYQHAMDASSTVEEALICLGIQGAEHLTDKEGNFKLPKVGVGMFPKPVGRKFNPALGGLLQHLMGDEREFALTFRTFGKDQASAFSFEWMKYCSGEGHGNDGKDGAPQTIWTGVKSVTCGQDLTLTTPDQRGDAYRTDTKGTACTLVVGAFARPQKCDLSDPAKIAAAGPFVKVLTDSQEISQHVAKQAAMLVQDDYAAWSASNFNSSQGKLLMLAQEDTTTHKIFFASDLCREEFEVDVREAKTGEQIPWSKADGLNVIASGNDKWYVEKNFFIEELEKAETKRDQEIFDLKNE